MSELPCVDQLRRALHSHCGAPPQITEQQQRRLDQAEAEEGVPGRGLQQLRALRMRSASAPPGSIPPLQQPWPPALPPGPQPRTPPAGTAAGGQAAAGAPSAALQQQQQERVLQKYGWPRPRRGDSWHLQQQQQQQSQPQQPLQPQQPVSEAGPSSHSVTVPRTPWDEQVADMDEDSQAAQPARSIPVPVSPIGAQLTRSCCIAGRALRTAVTAEPELGVHLIATHQCHSLSLSLTSVVSEPAAARPAAEARPRHRPPSPPQAGSLAAFTAGAAGGR
jgi:hypothetical protein